MSGTDGVRDGSGTGRTVGGETDMLTMANVYTPQHGYVDQKWMGQWGHHLYKESGLWIIGVRQPNTEPATSTQYITSLG